MMAAGGGLAHHYPAFAQVLVTVSPVTRAVIVRPPLAGIDTKRQPSSVLHMSAPLPVTVYTPLVMLA